MLPACLLVLHQGHKSQGIVQQQPRRFLRLLGKEANPNMLQTVDQLIRLVKLENHS